MPPPPLEGHPTPMGRIAGVPPASPVRWRPSHLKRGPARGWRSDRGRQNVPPPVEGHPTPMGRIAGVPPAPRRRRRPTPGRCDSSRRDGRSARAIGLHTVRKPHCCGAPLLSQATGRSARAIGLLLAGRVAAAPHCSTLEIASCHPPNAWIGDGAPFSSSRVPAGHGRLLHHAEGWHAPNRWRRNVLLLPRRRPNPGRA